MHGKGLLKKGDFNPVAGSKFSDPGDLARLFLAVVESRDTIRCLPNNCFLWNLCSPCFSVKTTLSHLQNSFFGFGSDFSKNITKYRPPVLTIDSHWCVVKMR